MTEPWPEPHELWSGDPTEMAATIADAIRRLRQSPESAGFQWLMAVADDAFEAGISQISEQLLEACRNLLPTLGDTSEREAVSAQLDNRAGLLALRTGRLEDALRLLRAAADASRRVGDALEEALAEQNLAGALWLSGNLSEARHHALAALAIYLSSGDNVRQAQMLINLANYDLEEGKIDEAEARLDEAQSLATTRSAVTVRTSILGTRGLVARARGDQTLAGTVHRKVLRRARRIGNIGQLRMATQNMGSWYGETGQPWRAASWLGHAANLAMREGNAQLAGQLLRSRSVQLFRAKRFNESISVMRTAILISEEAQDDKGTAEGRADLAAFLIGFFQNDVTGASSADSDLLAEAGSLLDSSLEYFQRVGDAAWIERVHSNGVSLALAHGQPLQALDRLVAARESVASTEHALRITIDRRGMSIAASDARRPDLAAGFVRHGAAEAAAAPSVAAVFPPAGQPPGVRISNAAMAGAWELAIGAAGLREYPFALTQVIELYGEARDLLSEGDALRFHITNDLGSTYAESGDTSAAIECFESCLAIAEASDDRVMRQQALANRAEMARRQSEPQALDQLGEAASIAADLGDLPAQAAALMNLATAYIDNDRLDEAEAVVTQVSQLLELIDTPRDDQARLLVIRGNIAAARRDLETARSHYLSAAELSTGAERIEAEGAALWSLALDGQRDKYRRLLQRVIRVGQRDKLDGVVAKAILPSAEAWLNAGVTNLSTRTYAAAIVLALVQWSNSQPVTTEPNVDDLPSGADSVIYVIARMVSDLSRVPSLRPRVTDDVLAHLRRDLPDQLDEIVVTWIEELTALLPTAERPPDEAR